MTDSTPGDRPASGYRWPDATPGNFIALKHGAWSERLVRPVADEIERGIDVLVQKTPAEGPSFAAARGALALRLARLQRVSAYIDEAHGGLPINTETGEPLPASRLEAELLASVDRSLDALGLTPASAAKLGVDLLRGGSLAAEMQAALDARARADARMNVTPDEVTP